MVGKSKSIHAKATSETELSAMLTQDYCILDRDDKDGVRNTTKALQSDKKFLICFNDAKTTLRLNIILIFKNLNSEFNNTYILFSESM